MIKMKTVFRYLILCIIVITILSTLSNAQNYSIEQIPNPYSNVLSAKLLTGSNNSLYLIGLSDTFSSTYFGDELGTKILFLATRNMDGFSKGFNVIDTGHYESTGFSGFDDEFNCSLAEDSIGQIAVTWAKQHIQLSDVMYPRIFSAPSVRLAIKTKNSFQRLCEYRNTDNPQIIADQNNTFHLVRQSVSPLYPTSPNWNRYGPDSNYSFFTSQILYNQIQADGISDSIINLGNGYFPHIHIDKSGTVHVLWLRSDSSNSKFYQLVYARKAGIGFNSTIVIKDSIRVLLYNDIYGFPTSYASFVDDSGMIYIGWTDNIDYTNGKIFLVSISQRETVRIDSVSGLALLGSRAKFSVDRSGMINIIWQTYVDGTGWSLHYTQGSNSQQVFATTRTFHSPDPYMSDPLIIIDSKKVAQGIFTDSQNGIGYLRNLEYGLDTIMHVNIGSSIGYGFNGPSLPQSKENSVAIDNSDQVWVLCSQNGLSLMKIDRSVTGVKKNNLDPRMFSLSQNFPNPFNPTTTISFVLPSRSFVSLKMFDMLGREVETIISGEMLAGSYSKQWNAANVSSGIYFYRLQAGSFTETKKLILLK